MTEKKPQYHGTPAQRQAQERRAASESATAPGTTTRDTVTNDVVTADVPQAASAQHERRDSGAPLVPADTAPAPGREQASELAPETRAAPPAPEGTVRFVMPARPDEGGGGKPHRVRTARIVGGNDERVSLDVETLPEDELPNPFRYHRVNRDEARAPGTWHRG